MMLRRRRNREISNPNIKYTNNNQGGRKDSDRAEEGDRWLNEGKGREERGSKKTMN
jgi:hypothetical protein